VLVSAWAVDPVKILTRRELASLLADLGRRAPRSASQSMNWVIFRLACCCGLGVSEIGALQLADVCAVGGHPHLRVGPDGARGKRGRIDPCGGTLEDLAAWRRERGDAVARPADAFVCCLWPSRYGHRLIVTTSANVSERLVSRWDSNGCGG
jgi:integrase